MFLHFSAAIETFVQCFAAARFFELFRSSASFEVSLSLCLLMLPLLDVTNTAKPLASVFVSERLLLGALRIHVALAQFLYSRFEERKCFEAQRFLRRVANSQKLKCGCFKIFHLGSTKVRSLCAWTSHPRCFGLFAKLRTNIAG